MRTSTLDIVVAFIPNAVANWVGVVGCISRNAL